VLSIGALSRATGIPIDTLRTWERRYGIPAARRKASGHRVYALDTVTHLQRIIRALERGHRPADIMNLTDRQLDELLDVPRAPARATGRAPTRISDLMDAVRAWDDAALRLALERAAARRAPLEFLTRVVTPLLSAIGRAWERGRLDVRHEHFASTCLAEQLRELRRRHEPATADRVAALGMLPGDMHELGLLMAAVVFSAAGWRVLYLGRETPPQQLAALANEVPLDAVAVSVSLSVPIDRSASAIEELRSKLPSEIPLLVGGTGAPPPRRGWTRFEDLPSLERWLQVHAS
jgi:methanogenic corrinoid protein MtbC1